jgi:hypothetical protein
MRRWRLLVGFGLLGAVAALGSAASAQVAQDDFESDTPRSTLWSRATQGNVPQAGQGGGLVAMFLPAQAFGAGFGTFYGSIPRLRGDFDIQIDYNLPLWPRASGVRVGLNDGGDNILGAVERVSFGPPDLAGPPGEWYVTDFLTPRRITRTAASDLSGKLRMVRSGATVSGYRWDNATGDWVLLRKAPALTADVHFGFGIWSQDPFFAGENVLVTFAHFRVNQGTLIPPP